MPMTMGAIAGFVVDSNGQPVAGVQVTIVTAHSNRQLTALSDGQGRFLFTGLSSGRYLIRAIADGWIGGAEVKLLDGASAIVEVPVGMIGSWRLGRPIEGVPESDEPPETPIPEQTDDDTGIAELPGDDAGTPISEQPSDEIDELPGDDPTVPEPGTGPDIEFVYGGKKYIVGADADLRALIMLPDKTLLSVGGWLETYPPSPVGMNRTSYTSIRSESPRRAAERLGATLAREDRR